MSLFDPFQVKPGQSVRFTVPMAVLGDVPNPLPATLTLTLECLESGAPDAPIVDASPVYDGVGQDGRASYHSDQVIPIGATPGRWARRWQASGPTPPQCALSERTIYVESLDF